jgi:hypothetical protein
MWLRHKIEGGHPEDKICLQITYFTNKDMASQEKWKK